MVNGRNVRNRNMLRRMGYRKAGMTRREWLQKAGLAAAGVGVAAVGGSRLAHAEGENTVIRPIEDWLLNNGDYPFWSWNSLAETGYHAAIYYDYVPGPLPGSELPGQILQGGTVDGYLQEKALSDGSTELTVHLFGIGAPLRVYRLPDFLLWRYFGGPAPTTIIEDGNINYQATLSFILDQPPGEEIPSIIRDITKIEEGIGSWPAYLLGVVSLRLSANGYGIFEPEAASIPDYTGTPFEGFVPQTFNPGKTGNISIVVSAPYINKAQTWVPKVANIKVVEIGKQL